MKFLDVPQSGSVAGVTSSRNRFGQYRRTRAVPVNVNSDAQNEVRGNLAANSVAWRSLTDSERTAWQDYANSHPRTDSLGQTIILTGFQAFVGINNTLRLLGVATTTTPPAEALSTPGVIGAVASSAGAITVTTTAPTLLNQWLIFCSPPRSQGVNFNRDYRYVGNLPAAAAGSFDMFGMLNTKFGDFADGSKFFLRFVEQTGGVTQFGVDRTVIYEA